jgi:citrate lyase subunit beta / citryl-CoA lyase
MVETQFFRSYLYAPASKPELVEKAFNSQADCIVIDLEDAVHHDKKDEARRFVVDFLSKPASKPFLVRINDLNGPWGVTDLESISSPNLFGIRIPKTASVDTVKKASKILDAKKSNAQIHLLIESALGVVKAFELSSCDPKVAAISLGEADLLSDLRATNDESLAFSRLSILLAARAAGIKQPSQSVYANTKDLKGLEESTIKAKATGFFGRSIIHPSHIEIVNTIYTPTKEEAEKAEELLGVYEQMQAAGNSVMALPNGEMIDPANIHYAKFQLNLYKSLNK